MGAAMTEDEQRTYPPGVPCWVDTEQPDPEAACAFYAGLFGWEFEDVMPPGAPGFYFIGRLDGRDVAAVGPHTGGTPVWNTYVAVEDADRSAEQVTALGGTVPGAPEDAGPGGRAATCADPQGARFRLWQPRRRLGAQAVNGPGSWVFSQLGTTDRAAAQAFYGSLFGWEGDESGLWRRPGYGDHLEATVDPDIRARQAQAPPGYADAVAWVEPTDGAPHWRVTFSVADREAAIGVAEGLGGVVVGEPVEDQWTRTVVIRDPQGAELTLSQFAPRDW
jgi:predicted enzyme related to lactoylglutathione lyase